MENSKTITKITGNEQAFDAVFKQYYKGLCAFASQYLPDTECEEVVQEVMMWLWENRSMLESGASVKSLLFTIVKNKSLNRISHHQVRSQVHEQLYNQFESRFEDPDFYAQEELFAEVNRAINNLPEDYRTAFEMNRFDRLTYNEIAQKMGVTPKTIAYRISQALKILRVELCDFLPLL
ncbi:RNA polymerase sigma-70 factor [Parabacteroides sp. OttesenSCG-928-N08]|nr:RNA polymerase sigma-70 factor [Parabacteroides sp. OttesenSCG-928-N08]